MGEELLCIVSVVSFKNIFYCLEEIVSEALGLSEVFKIVEILRRSF